MTDNIYFLIIGGLGFFFFGMQTLSEGLKKISGERLKQFLHTVTKHPLVGVFVGTFVTCMIQSSSATTVMVVGFVNAGLLGLRQAIVVIMGANIGTTFTAWLVSSMSVFKITSYALPAVGIGFLIMTFCKTKRRSSWGQVLIGFGILFIGLHFLKDAFSPLKESEFTQALFIQFSANPWLGAAVGAIFTMLLQSSSATIAIVQVLALNGVISFDAAIPLVIGGNIGTTITAQLAAIGANINARRAAMSHTIFNVLGAVYMLVIVDFGWFGQFINYIIPGEITLTNIMFHIAVAHSIFNVSNTLIFLPFIPLLEKASIWLVPKNEDSIDFGTQYLEKHLLETPSLALEQVRNEIIYMLGVAKKAVYGAVNTLLENDIKGVDKVIELENVTDNLQSEITQYIVDLSQKNLLRDQSLEIPVLIHNVNDIERIGDHAQDLAQLASRKIEEKMKFSDSAVIEIKEMWTIMQEMLDDSIQALKTNDIYLAKKILEHEDRINKMQDKFKQEHILRLNEGSCTLNSGFVFLEIIDNLEKIGDRLANVGESVAGRMKWETKEEHKIL